MEWTHEFESEEIDRLEALQDLMRSLETTGTINSVSVMISADAPINVQTLPDSLSPETDGSVQKTPPAEEESSAVSQTTKYSTGSGGPKPEQVAAATTAEVSSSDSGTTESTEAAVAEDTVEDVVEIRKWPQLDQKVRIESDLPLPAAAYPCETVEFNGQSEGEVEHGTPYHVRVNGTKEYGAFVTLTGSGYSPNSQYTDVTGLLHHSEMLRRGPTDYTQGDSLVVELIEHSDKGLSFRELPLLSTEDAKQARHAELTRLSKLDVDEGETITFSTWPDSREQTGTVDSINYGTDQPPKPPTVVVKSGSETYSINPSEIVATVETLNVDTGSTGPGELQQGATLMSAAPDELALSADINEPPASTETDTIGSPDSEITGTTDNESDASEAPAEDSDAGGEEDEDQTESDEEFDCVCGETFESRAARGGHQRWCDEYQAQLAAEDEETDTPETEASTTENGRVLNPIVLDAKYEYTKVAVALYLADADELPVRGVADVLEGTDWEMKKSNINAHLNQLQEKEAVTREKDDVYVYSLTKRGAAGVEQMLEDVDDPTIPGS